LSGILVVKGSGGGGLGDRLRSVLVALLYCRLSGRHLYVDWRDGVYAPLGQNSFSELFQVESVPVVDQLPAGVTTVAPEAWRGRIHRTMHDVYVEDGNVVWDRSAAITRYSFDMARLDCAEAVLVMWEFDQLPKLLNKLTFEERALPTEMILRRVFAAHLRPNLRLQDAAARLVPNGDRSIGVHVRATHEAMAQKGYVGISSYFDAVDRLVEKTRIGTIVLATDNATVENKFRERYNTVITYSKWLPEPGASIHLNPTCPDLLDAAKDALIEILMLARCGYLVTLGNSSFSIIARVISQAPLSRQVILLPQQTLKKRVVYKLQKFFRVN
jgi:hypothetical protein